MKRLIEHNIQAQITNEAPKIRFEIGYQDNFSDDRYLFENTSNNTNNLKFNVIKNGKQFLDIDMKERNVDLFLTEFLNSTKDDDFNQEFKKIIHVQNKIINFVI
mgnify:CR=1 FL=1